MLQTDIIILQCTPVFNILPHNHASGIYTIIVDFTSEFLTHFSHKALF